MCEVSQFYIPFFKNCLRVKLTQRGVREIHWQKNMPDQVPRLNSEQKKVARAIDKFTKGKGSLIIQVDWEGLAGTEFQKKVWKKMIQIPYGETRSYGTIAKSIKKPGAARAVGTACAKNPVLLAIPCHRVVGCNGLGGFSGGGLQVKRQLLAIEAG